MILKQSHSHIYQIVFNCHPDDNSDLLFLTTWFYFEGFEGRLLVVKFPVIPFFPL